MTFVLGIVGSMCWWKAYNPQLHWWLRSVSVFCSEIVVCLLKCRWWNSVYVKNWQWRYYLVSTFTTILTVGAFLPATSVLGMVGSLCYWRIDNPWLQWCLWPVSVFCSGTAFDLRTGRHGNSVNKENWWWGDCLISNVTTIIDHWTLPICDLWFGYGWELVLPEG